MRRSLLPAVLLLLLVAPPAPAHGWLFRRPAEVRYYSYYAPAPVYWMPVRTVAYPVYVQPLIEVAPPPVVSVPALAVPVPAPPSTLPEVPRMPPADTTARRADTSFFDLYTGTGRGGAADRASVAFWNLTPGVLTLRVGGQERALPPGRSVRLDLPRLFAWEVAGRGAQTATIPAGHTTAELLIRR